MKHLSNRHIESLLAIRFRENEVPRNLDALRFARSFYEAASGMVATGEAGSAGPTTGSCEHPDPTKEGDAHETNTP